ncbi:MAG TPA: hypothetical protein VGN72_01730 [Tepidisphaeraceae bacterium]|jgi:hypothetical protein|nr:hypothetical protein [Tepidisphaeraceae bacterium]
MSKVIKIIQRRRRPATRLPVEQAADREDRLHRGGDDDDADPGVAAIVDDAFRVVDEATASWVVRKIVECRAYAARARDWAERELRRAERDEQWLLRRFGAELEGWLRDELGRRGGRARSVPLPAGTVGLRRQPGRLEVIDEPSLVAWCERHLREALRVTVDAEGDVAAELARWQRARQEDARVRKQVMREALNRHVAELGEVPDGVTVSSAEDRLYVK